LSYISLNKFWNRVKTEPEKRDLGKLVREKEENSVLRRRIFSDQRFLCNPDQE